MILGRKIKQLREDKGVTQHRLAQILNVSSQAVSKWKNDVTYPYITLIPAIADYFNIS